MGLAVQVLLCVIGGAWVYEIYFYMRYILSAVRRTRSHDVHKEMQDYPGVSVIVCARNEEMNVGDYLQALLTQDYPEYEVIVVDDGSVDETRRIIERMQKRYANLRLTFVPVGAQVISTKKLAITLGAKAARYDYLLLTDADCRPESLQWIKRMMEGFVEHGGEEKDIVLGVGVYFSKPTLLNRLIQFDTLLSGLQYIGMAACGHPYMGVGRNLAYRKRMFFSHQGFAGLLDKRSGDDDLYVNRHATGRNTAVVASADSLTWSVPKTNWQEWIHQKRRHLSVAPEYTFISRLRLLIEPLMRGVFYAVGIALLVIGGRDIWLIVAALWLLRWLVQAVLLNTAAHRWGTTQTWLLIPLWDVVLPLVTGALLLLQPMMGKQKRW